MHVFAQVCICALVLLFSTAAVFDFVKVSLGQSNSVNASVVLVGAGDIADCSTTASSEAVEATARLLDVIEGTVFTLGDNVYTTDPGRFQECYGPTWGRQKARTMPSVGNHEYDTVNGDSNATDYYTYFQPAASPMEPSCTSNCKGYYSYNLGDWHIIVLNSEIVGTEQVQWLQADLAANQNVCTLAYWHHPRFSSGGNTPAVAPFWEALYQAKADVVLNGHRHFYEHLAPQNPQELADPEGLRQFVVGTGGASLVSFGSTSPKPNTVVRDNSTHGVLKLTLHPTSYDWQFVPVAGETFTDSGSATCIGAPQGGIDTPTPTDTPTATSTATSTDTPTMTSTATATNTPTPTATATALAIATNTPTATNTAMPIDTPTPTGASLEYHTFIPRVLGPNP